MKHFRAAHSPHKAVKSITRAQQSSRQLSIAIPSSATTSSQLRSPNFSQAYTPKIRLSTLNASRRHSSTSSPSNDLLKTPLYDLHRAHNAKMVPFASYSMPISYPSLTHLQSHNFTRTHCSLFDVSHMTQHQFHGSGALGLLERITPSDLSNLPIGMNTYSVLLWPNGGIADDCIITRLGEQLWYVVTNAGTREKVLDFLRTEIGIWRGDGKEKVAWDVLEGWGLVALQGPKCQEVLEEVIVDREGTDLGGLNAKQCVIAAVTAHDGKKLGPLLVSRGGYTGEDGFEIAIPPKQAPRVVEALLLSSGPKKVQLAGLGARDSLRLEAGMCLYGSDISDERTPVEASLAWVVAKPRRLGTDFNGAEKILQQLQPAAQGGGTEQRLVGLVVEGAPARAGAVILDTEGQKIGSVTSGGPSPTLGKNIAMGYVDSAFKKVGTEVQVKVRNKECKATISKMAHYPNKYHKSGAGHMDLGSLEKFLQGQPSSKTNKTTPVYMKAWDTTEQLPE